MNDFFASIYEAIPTFGIEYSLVRDGMFNQSLYLPAGIWTLLLAVSITSIFYIVIDHGRFNRKIHWIVIGTISSLVSFFIGYYYVHLLPHRLRMDTEYQGAIPDVSRSAVEFGFYNVLFFLTLFFILSFVMRYQSSMNKNNPF
jgi:hypothetical protein